ncbi:MAG TPA: hypothetical protein PLI51_09840 [bacterium]|nr:hypothetical protein [bacterium]HPQ67013.1 hypothetical protein [bacterium]
MNEPRCPHLESCFIAGLLKATRIPTLASYCGEHYPACVYFRQFDRRRPRETAETFD